MAYDTYSEAAEDMDGTTALGLSRDSDAHLRLKYEHRNNRLTAISVVLGILLVVTLFLGIAAALVVNSGLTQRAQTQQVEACIIAGIDPGACVALVKAR
jgi:hypothetical protein